MKKWFFALGISLAAVKPTGAVPNVFFSNGNSPIPVIPAFPRFNSDLTREFLDLGSWQEGEFSGPWEDEPSLPDLSIRRMSAMPIVFGEIPMSIHSYSGGEGVDEVAIHFLDAGIYFGYLGSETTREQRDAMRQRRVEFSRHFKKLSDSLLEKLEDGCGRGTEGRLGRTPMLSLAYTDFTWEGFVLRYVEREDHSISLHLFRKGAEPKSMVENEWNASDRRERQDILEGRLVSQEDESVSLPDFPVFSQGSTPFCGIHSLAMVGHYLGLRTSPGMLAASADFKNTGSAAGSDMMELHRAVASELEMNLSVAPRLDPKRIERSLRDGVPVLIWRRVSPERENYHREVAGKEIRFEPLSEEEWETVPSRKESGPSHASVITGIDREGEVIHYVEPWGHAGLDRRMRLEEAEATTYAVFYFKL